MKTITEILDIAVRPLLNAHGGDVELIDVTRDGYVKVKLTGACAGCPGAQQTLIEVVETSLKAHLPAIKGVLAEQQVSDELLREALAIIRKKA